MPDLKSEMSKVLSAWEQEEQQAINQPQQEKQVQTTQTAQPKLAATIFQPTNNVTLETFNYVRDNPNATNRQACDALSARGFNPNSVGSLLTQFVKQGQMARDHNGRHIVLVPAYTPLKSTKKFRAEGLRINKIVNIRSKKPSKPKTPAPKSTGIAALKVDTTPKAVPTKVITQWDADTIINNIGLKQARSLYDELKKIFGG